MLGSDDLIRLSGAEYSHTQMLHELYQFDINRDLYASPIEMLEYYFDIAFSIILNEGFLNTEDIYSLHTIDIDRIFDAEAGIIACTFGIDRSKLLAEYLSHFNCTYTPMNYHEYDGCSGIPAASIHILNREDGFSFINGTDSLSVSIDHRVNIVYCIDPSLIWDRGKDMSLYSPDLVTLVLLVRRIIDSGIGPRNLRITIVYGSEMDFGNSPIAKCCVAATSPL